MPDFFAEREALEKCREGKGTAEVGWIAFDAFEIGVLIASEKRLFDRFHFAHFAEEDDFSRQLTFESFEVSFALNIDPNGGSRHWTFCRWRPGRGLRDKDSCVGRSHAHPGV